MNNLTYLSLFTPLSPKWCLYNIEDKSVQLLIQYFKTKERKSSNIA